MMTNKLECRRYTNNTIHRQQYPPTFTLKIYLVDAHITPSLYLSFPPNIKMYCFFFLIFCFFFFQNETTHTFIKKKQGKHNSNFGTSESEMQEIKKNRGKQNKRNNTYEFMSRSDKRKHFALLLYFQQHTDSVKQQQQQKLKIKGNILFMFVSHTYTMLYSLKIHWL